MMYVYDGGGIMRCCYYGEGRCVMDCDGWDWGLSRGWRTSVDGKLKIFADLFSRKQQVFVHSLDVVLCQV